jgi:hypothetical protein
MDLLLTLLPVLLLLSGTHLLLSALVLLLLLSPLLLLLVLVLLLIHPTRFMIFLSISAIFMRPAPTTVARRCDSGSGL